MKKFIFLLLLLTPFIGKTQIEQIWKTDYQITSDTFNTFGYKTDGSGNFYLYGWQHNQIFIQKNSQDGSILWTINNDSIVANPDVISGGDTISREISNSRITDIAFNQDGNILISGLTSVQVLGNPNAESNVFISNVLSNGTISWKKNFSTNFNSLGATKWNQEVKITYSAQTNSTYLSSAKLRAPLYCNGQYDLNYCIVKLDSIGNILWNQTFLGDSTYCSKDIITSLFFKDTLITLSGFSTSPYPSQGKLISFNLDANGNLINHVEEKQFIADPYSDQSLNLYLPDAFTTHGQSQGNTSYITTEIADSVQTDKRNLMILKYNQSLDKVRRYDFQKDTSANLEIEKSLIDDSCNLLVSGIWKEKGQRKAFLLKLDSSGTEQFRDTFSNEVESNLCFVTNNGETLLFTSFLSNSAYTTSIRKYSANGVLVWDSTLGVSGKIIHGFVDSADMYLVLLNGKTLTYLKYEDKSPSLGLTPRFTSQPRIYPNPATDVLHIYAPDNETSSYTYQIFGLSGDLQSSGRAESGAIELRGLKPGMYILRLTDSFHTISTGKFIKE